MIGLIPHPISAEDSDTPQPAHHALTKGQSVDSGLVLGYLVGCRQVSQSDNRCHYLRGHRRLPPMISIDIICS